MTLSKKQVNWICEHLEFIARLYESSQRDHRNEKARAFRRVIGAIQYEAPEKLTLDELRTIKFIGPSIMSCLYELDTNNYRHMTGFASRLMREASSNASASYSQSWLIEMSVS